MDCDGCDLTLWEFLMKCQNQDELLNFLREHGVLIKTLKCPKCDNVCKLSAKLRWFCGKQTVVRGNKTVTRKKCNFTQSLLKNTWFSHSRKKIQDVCMFVVYWICIHPPRQAFMEFELNTTARTVVDWSMFCREVCTSWCERNSEVLGGSGITVEIDEAKLGKRKDRGRVIEGQWIVGGFERESEKMFVIMVPNRTKETLITIIKKWVQPGTTIVSDCFRLYDCLKDVGLQHYNVNNSEHFVDPNAGAHTQNIEETLRDVRDNIPKYGRREHHFAGYLSEFLWKRSVVDRRGRIHAFFKEIATEYNPAEDRTECTNSSDSDPENEGENIE